VRLSTFGVEEKGEKAEETSVGGERTSEVLKEVRTLWNTLCRQGNPWAITE
jgi:hypothetical protein